MIGTTKAGRYRIDKKIGEGGMGVVWQAHDLRLDCKVALKEIKAEHLHDPQYRARLAQEARAAAAINHPGIARSIDFVDEGNDVFVVYEFVEGVTLRRHLTGEALSVSEAMDVAIKVADALHAAHDLGFIHRDIKPENIMLSPRPEGFPRVKILDFGLTKRLWLLNQGSGTVDVPNLTTVSQALVGTLDYMSPEQVNCQPLDRRSDIFSLGVVMYEMMTGRNPFRGGNVGSTISNIQNLDPPSIAGPRANGDVRLDEMVRKCLYKNRDGRYASAQQLVRDLDGFRPLPPPRPHPLPPPSPSPEEDEPPIPRGVARALLLITQIGYLVMYSLAYHYLPSHVDRLSVFGIAQPVMALVFFAVLLLGAVVHVYLLSSVGFDYKDSGRLFRQIFIPLLVLDSLWAAIPLLLFKELEWKSWLCVVGLAYLPFSQRYLIYAAYDPRGGRSSGVRVGMPA